MSGGENPKCVLASLSRESIHLLLKRDDAKARNAKHPSTETCSGKGVVVVRFDLPKCSEVSGLTHAPPRSCIFQFALRPPGSSTAASTYSSDVCAVRDLDLKTGCKVWCETTATCRCPGLANVFPSGRSKSWKLPLCLFLDPTTTLDSWRCWLAHAHHALQPRRSGSISTSNKDYELTVTLKRILLF